MLSLPRRLQTVRVLSWRDRAAWAESLILFWGFRLVLPLVPIRWFKPLLGPVGEKFQVDPGATTTPLAPDALMVARWMGRIARRHQDTCLPQALTARVMLRRRHLPSTVSFGVRQQDDGEYRFHAWVAHDHRVLTGGGRLGAYSVIATHHDQ